MSVPAPRAAALVAGVYATLAALATWPVIGAAATHVPHDLGDPVMSLALLGWNAAVRPLSERWWDGIGFYPVAGTLAMSDPRLGVSLLTMPVLLAGMPVLAYDAAFVLSFALSAIAAHALVYSLTRSHSAGLIAGCAYGFAPFRAAHLSHIEVLSSYWMPLALLGLHRWSAAGSRRGLAVFAAAFALQGLFCAYYVPLFGAMVTAWLVWLMMGRASATRVLGVVGGAVVAAVLLAPILVPIARVHHALELARRTDEVEMFSADLSGLWSAAPALRFWPTHPAANTEGYLFPGVMVLVVIVAALWRTPDVYTAWAGHPDEGAERSGPPELVRPTRRRRVLRAVLLLVTLLCVALSVLAFAHVEWRIAIGQVVVTAGSFRKPLSIAAVTFVAWMLLGRRTSLAIRRHGVFAFYVWAATLMFVLALGPTPRALGVPFLYKPPYAWLMAVPVVGGSIRAPARFGMMIALALAAAAGLAWHRLSAARPRGQRHRLTAAVAGAILLEGWFAPVAILSAPHASAWPSVCAGLPRLELPFGGVEAEAAAQYRAFLAGVRSINGASGYFPPFTTALSAAVSEHDDGALEALAEHGPVCIEVHPATKDGGDMSRWLTASGRPSRVETSRGSEYFLLPRTDPAPSERARGAVLGLTAVRATEGSPNVEHLQDGDPVTIWGTAGEQRPGMAIEFDLACEADVEQVEIAQGIHTWAFADALAIDAQSRGGQWTTMWRGRMGGLAVRSALADPRVTVRVNVTAAGVRAVRLRLERAVERPWAIAEAAVRGHCR